MGPTVGINFFSSGSVSVHLTGELDLVAAPSLTEQFDAALSVCPHLVVHLDEVTFLDAVVISTIISAYQKALAGGGRLVLVGASPWVEKVLRAARVTELVSVLPAQRRLDGSRGEDNPLTAALRNRRTTTEPVRATDPRA